MKQPWLFLFVGFLAASSMPLKLVQCSKSANEIHDTSCYNTSSKRTCFTTFSSNNHLPVRMSFENASDWCKEKVPGSSLIVIKSAEDQQIVQDFIGSRALENETIIMDARKLSIHESQNWSWVNGYQIIPNVAGDNRLTAVALNFEQNLPAYLLLSVVLSSRYICEFSGSMPTFSYKHNNKIYAASQTVANWYDARNKCLRLGGDLASITDLKTIGNWSWLSINHGYWIGLHRNMWVWNRTGEAITYTNWKDGYQNETSNSQCICIYPQCRRENNQTIYKCHQKWRTCNCNHNYAIVCQKQEDSDVSITEIVVTEEMLPSTSPDLKSSASFPDNTAGEIDRKTASSSSVTQNPSNQFAENQTIAFVSSSTEFFNAFTIKQLLLILLLFVTVAIIVFVVILVIRKCKKRNERSSMKEMNQEEAIYNEYKTMVRDKRPSDDIYTELELSQQPTPSSNSIYANVQPTDEAVNMDMSVIYVNTNEI